MLKKIAPIRSLIDRIINLGLLSSDITELRGCLGVAIRDTEGKVEQEFYEFGSKNMTCGLDYNNFAESQLQHHIDRERQFLFYRKLYNFFNEKDTTYEVISKNNHSIIFVSNLGTTNSNKLALIVCELLNVT